MKIYRPTGAAGEYSTLALNYFSGCTHNCSYCYVRNINEISKNGVTQDKCKAPPEKGFVELEASAKKFKDCNKQILLSFTGDPYCDMPNDTTRRVLTILNKYEHKVAILTKGGNRVLQDIDLFKNFESRDLFSDNIPRIKVGATLTFDNDTDSAKWEPGAASPQERIESLRKLSELGIRTWVSFEPVIFPEQSLNLLQQVSGFVDHVGIGKINHYNNLDKEIDWNDFIKKSVAICRGTDLKFYIKDDLVKFNRDTVLRDEERSPNFFDL